MTDARGNEINDDYGWTIERYCPYPGGGCYDQSALPYEVVKAHSWDKKKNRCYTYEEAEKWAENANAEAKRYWKARMTR